MFFFFFFLEWVKRAPGAKPTMQALHLLTSYAVTLSLGGAEKTMPPAGRGWIFAEQLQSPTNEHLSGCVLDLLFLVGQVQPCTWHRPYLTFVMT